MTIEEAKKLLDEEYERVKRLEYVKNPLAYALHQVWKKVDTENALQQTDLTNKCGSCKWSIPCMFGTKGKFGSYVECRNQNKVWRHEISKKRQRTTPKCRYYEKTLAKGAKMENRELKQCPFCGGKAEVVPYSVYGKVKSYFVHCCKCGCQSRDYTSKQNAEKYWNRRADNGT